MESAPHHRALWLSYVTDNFVMCHTLTAAISEDVTGDVPLERRTCERSEAGGY